MGIESLVGLLHVTRVKGTQLNKHDRALVF